MKDKAVKKNPATMGGRFHDSSSYFLKHLRSRQRRLVDEKLTFEGYLEHFNCELDIIDMEVSDLSFGEDPTLMTLEERIVALARQCGFEEDWMLEERLCGTIHSLVLVHNGQPATKGWREAVKTGPQDPNWDFLMGR